MQPSQLDGAAYTHQAHPVEGLPTPGGTESWKPFHGDLALPLPFLSLFLYFVYLSYVGKILSPNGDCKVEKQMIQRMESECHNRAHNGNFF